MKNNLKFNFNLTLEEIDINSYKFLYNNSEYSTPFHSIEFLDSIQKSRKDLVLKFNILYLEDKILGIMPFFKKKFFPFVVVSLPYGCYGGYLYLKKDEYIFKESINKIFKSKIFFKINSYNNEIYKMIKNVRCTIQHTWVIETSDKYENIFQRLHSKTKNQIRKSVKEGIVVKNLLYEEELEQVISIYSQLIKKHNIKKPYNRALFESLYKYNISSDNILFKIAKKDDKVIAYSVFLKNNFQIFYWMNASHKDYTKFNGTNAILNDIIYYSTMNKIEELNLGAIPLGNKGLEHFKKRWNATKKSYYIFKRIF